MKKETEQANEDKIINFPKNENHRTKKAEPKGRNKSRTIVLYAFLLLVVVFVVYNLTADSTFNSTNDVNTEIISLANANNYDFAPYKDGYVLAKDGKISCYNTNQSVQWEITGSKTAPNVIVNENYVLTYYNDDSVAMVTNGSKTVDISTPGNVQYGYVNSNGYCVLLVDEFGLKNKIVVYDKKGKMIYYRDNPDKFIAHVTLSDDDKSLATVELVTNESSVSSGLVITDIKTNKEISKIMFDNALPGGCIFTDSKNILSIFDTKILSHNTNGKLNWEIKFDNKALHEYSYDDGILACVFNKDDSAASGSEVSFFNKRGKSEGSFTTTEKVQGIDFKENSVLLTYAKRLVLTNLKGKENSQADITYDMKEIHLMRTKKCALIVSNSQTSKLLPLK